MSDESHVVEPTTLNELEELNIKNFCAIPELSKLHFVSTIRKVTGIGGISEDWLQAEISVFYEGL